MKVHQPLLVAALVASGVFVHAQDAMPKEGPASPREAKLAPLLAPAEKILGLELTSDGDKTLAEIRDLLIDPRSGEIRYAVVTSGGVLGVGADHHVVPWTYVQVSVDAKDAKKFLGRTQLTEAQLNAAPKCKPGEKLDAELDRRIESAFGKNDTWGYVGEGKPSFAWLSDMDDLVVKAPAGKEVGKVRSLVLAPQNGCIAFAVIDTNKESGDKDVGLPWSRLQYAYDRDGKLTASTTTEQSQFANAPVFDDKDWKRMSGTEWMTELCAYYGCDPFWKVSRFANARSSDPKRP